MLPGHSWLCTDFHSCLRKGDLMILAVDDVMKLPEFAVQNEKVIEEKLNAAELMITLS